MRKRARALLVCCVAAASWLGCNALLGIDDGTLIGNGDGGGESSVDASDAATADVADAGDASPRLSTTRNELRIPRGRTTTVDIAIDPRGLQGEVKVETASSPSAIKVLGTVATTTGMRATLKADDQAADVTDVVKFAATIAGRRGELDMKVRVRAPGTVDDRFPAAAGVEISKSASYSAAFPLPRGRKTLIALNIFGSKSEFLVTRIGEDGVADPMFGTNGAAVFQVPNGARECFPVLTTEPDESLLLVAACFQRPDAGPSVPVGGLVARLASDGGSLQEITYPLGPSTEKIVGVGVIPPRLIVSQTFDAGAPTFVRALDGSELAQLATFTAAGLATADGGYHLYGKLPDGGAVAQLDEQGTQRQGYGTGGFAKVPGVVPEDTLSAGTTAENGLAIALSNVAFPTRLVKLTPIGDPDLTFGAGGLVTLSSAHLYAALLVDDRNNVIVASLSATSVDLRRFRPDGAPDLPFGDNGTRNFAMGCIPAIAQDADGMILMTCALVTSTLYRIWP